MSVKSTKVEKLLIVDPNSCDSENINIEDLSITVNLEVYKRNEEIIVFNTNTDKVSRPKSSDIETTRISFIDGSGDDKVLTTNYTELNTTFNKNNPDLGTLGIESIDINFNTSYTPIVQIRFKDIRGKLFEMGDDSPYSFLFRMPYPIFYLTVKGYYGKPVRYALHLTKFNGALDSDTGSFIITCDFIGYTYAFLNDILMGFLKAIPYTDIGKSLLEEYDNFIGFKELYNIINKLETFITNFKKNDTRLKELNIYNNLIIKLNEIEGEISRIISFNGDGDITIPTENKLISYTDSKNNLSRSNITSINDGLGVLIDEYNNYTNNSNINIFELNKSLTSISSDGIYYSQLEINDFVIEENGINRFKTIDEFQSLSSNVNNGVFGPQNIYGIDKYENFRLNQLDENILQETNDLKENKIITKFYDELISIFKNPPFTNNGSILLNKSYNFMDTRFVKNAIDEHKISIQNRINDTQNTITKDFVQNLDLFFKEEGLGYDGSIGAIFDILCNHIDLFMATLRQLGTKILSDYNNGNRTIQNNDKSHFSQFSNDSNTNQIKINAFPEYVEQDADGTNVEQWLGKNEKFRSFREVDFIENLHEAILKQQKDEIDFKNNVNQLNNGWYPVNPLETTIYKSTNSNPWKIIKDEIERPIFKLLIQRMYTFLSYTNLELSDKEIINMAKIEANQAFEVIKENKVVLNRLSEINLNNILTILNDKINNDGMRLIEDGPLFYIHSNNYNSQNILNNVSYIPIIQTKSNLRDSSNKLNDEEFRNSYTEPFITSLNNDGIIKIINTKNYKTNDFNYQNYVNSNDGVVINGTNSTIFNSVYKTHEFLTLQNKTAGQIPVFYEFYENGDEIIKLNGKTTKLRDALLERIESKNYSIINFKPTLGIVKSTYSKRNYSLFGTEFYYKQNEYGKAFLFLHSIPFRGLSEGEGLLEGSEINYFNKRGGFVSVPYSWILFMGGILYRDSLEDDIIIFNDTQNNTYLPLEVSNNSELIEINVDKNSYLIRKNALVFGKSSGNLSFGVGGFYNVEINNIITNLPDSVKQVFINEFKNWVDDETSAWARIKSNFEVFNSIDDLYNYEVNAGENLEFLKDNFSDNYSKINRIPNVDNNFDLEIINDTNGNKVISDFLLTEKILLNSTYRIWRGVEPIDLPFVNSTTNVNTYLNTFFTTFKQLNETKKAANDDEEINKRLFNTNKSYDIKLSLYKNIKSIYDKWIIGIPENLDDSVITSNLRNRFKFIDRSYTNISDLFKVAPTSFIKLWHDNPNISFYSFIARLLRDNNFDFIPLPTFINYNNQKEVEDVFKPFRFNETIADSGPQFICMYFGEQSSQLNIDKDSKFKKNDSFKLDINCKGGKISVDDLSQLPKDYFVRKTNNDNDTQIVDTDLKTNVGSIPLVLVNYADQNQSIFKSFKLDQSEFTETQESLEIIENLSYGNRNGSIGQNLFDIYNNRSYSCEVEMLGSAQIQPFMYFQLNNIPMFDGAYTIINTRHSIKANHMTTTFKGVRIRAVKTKMVGLETLYTHLISNLNEVNSEGFVITTDNNSNNGSNNFIIDPAVITEVINGESNIETRISGIIIEG